MTIFGNFSIYGIHLWWPRPNLTH